VPGAEVVSSFADTQAESPSSAPERPPRRHRVRLRGLWLGARRRFLAHHNKRRAIGWVGVARGKVVPARQRRAAQSPREQPLASDERQEPIQNNINGNPNRDREASCDKSGLDRRAAARETHDGTVHLSSSVNLQRSCLLCARGTAGNFK
jgi:hypothetical protein